VMREHDIGAIPIDETDRLVGMELVRGSWCRELRGGLPRGRPTKA
jgi:hypothetical protein